VRGRITELLALPDGELIAAVAADSQADVAAELAGFQPANLRALAVAAGVEPVCRCDRDYPRRLQDLSNPPAVLYVAGSADRFLELAAGDPVAVVGARRASAYGLEVARALGSGLASAGMTVISGMALGIDSAAHAGALGVVGATVAVLPGPAERPYPRCKQALYNRIVATGAAVSELPPGAAVWRWAFPARNRMIAALSALTVVVEARERSGALITANLARELGRPVGAVPGPVTSPLAAAPNALIAAGAGIVRGAQDVLDALFGAGIRRASGGARRGLTPELELVLAAVGEGRDTVEAMVQTGVTPEEAFAGLSALELSGYVRRGPGGRYAVVP
jgi:DNA processing protein